MAEPNFATIANHFQGIHHEVTLVPNMPAMAGLNALQQQINANHVQVMGLFAPLQAHAVQMEVEVGVIRDQVGQLQAEVGGISLVGGRVALGSLSVEVLVVRSRLLFTSV